MELQEILSALRIKELTPMQEAACRACRSGRDVVLLSPTGTGKTLAFLLPLVCSLRADSDEVQAVVLVPSRELALQIAGVFRRMGTALRAVCCYGGRPAMEEHRTLKGVRPQLIIGTPGRMNDHLGKGNFNAGTVCTLVIDEFDKSLEFGFQEEMSQVLSRLPALRQRILLSATDAIEIPRFVGVEGQRLDFLPATDTADRSSRLELRQVESPQKDKLETLYRLLCTLGDASTLVFVNHRESADRVAGYLLAHRLPCDTFHGGMEQQERERALYKFRNGSCPVLVATDLAARGLDIQGMENVVHYHLPPTVEAFTHRNGRTARWDACGAAYLILHADECRPEWLPADIAHFDLPADTPRPPRPQWVTLYIGRGKKDKLNKVDIVGFLYKKGQLAREDVGPVDVKEHCAYAAVRRAKARQLLQLVQGEKIKGMKTLIEEAE